VNRRYRPIEGNSIPPFVIKNIDQRKKNRPYNLVIKPFNVICSVEKIIAIGISRSYSHKVKDRYEEGQQKKVVRQFEHDANLIVYRFLHEQFSCPKCSIMV